MRTMVGKWSILLALLAMFGLTIYAHRIIASGGGTFLPNLLRAGISSGGKADKPEVRMTSASAAALTQNLFAPETNADEEIALEPLQAGGSYNIAKSVVAGGGGNSSGGSNQLIGTIGQNAVGASTGGSFSLSGGFWNVSIGCPPISILPATLTNGVAGTPYPTTQLMASGGTPPYTFTIPVGSLPSGITLSSSGLLEGTPTAFGLFDFTARATDSTTTCFGERMYSLNILPPCGPISVGPQTLPNGFVGIAYPTQNFSAKGGTSPYTFSVSAGNLPNGLTLTTAGVLSGTPTVTDVFSFTIKVTDSLGCMGTHPYTVVISGSGANSLMFYPLSSPTRLLDTRSGQTACSAPGLPITGGTSLMQIARNFCGIPASAKAVTGNVTVVLPSANGFLTIYPSDATLQLVANTNFAAGDVLNNVFTVGLGAADGAFKIFASTTAEVVVDITGYYAPPEAAGLYFHPLPRPIRLLETRTGQPVGCFMPGTPLAANTDTTQQGTTTCDGVTIPAAAKALVGNATTVFPAANGFITLYPADAASRPLAASGNYKSGSILNSPFTVGLSPSGQFKIYTVAATDLVIDVLGYYSGDAEDVNGIGLLFSPVAPARLLDTRPGATGACFLPGAALTGGVESLQAARGVCTIANTARAIIGNATTVMPTANGFLTFWPSDAATRPLAATSNFQSGRNFNRYFTAGLGLLNGDFKMYASATTNLVIDVSGYFAP